MEFNSFESVYDGDHNSLGFVVIFNIFVMLDGLVVVKSVPSERIDDLLEILLDCAAHLVDL